MCRYLLYFRWTHTCSSMATHHKMIVSGLILFMSMQWTLSAPGKEVSHAFILIKLKNDNLQKWKIELYTSYRVHKFSQEIVHFVIFMCLSHQKKDSRELRSDFWNNKGKEAIFTALKVQPHIKRAKNMILFIGDGESEQQLSCLCMTRSPEKAFQICSSQTKEEICDSCPQNRAVVTASEECLDSGAQQNKPNLTCVSSLHENMRLQDYAMR